MSKKYIYFALFSLLAITIHAVYLFGFQVLLLFVVTYAVSTMIELVSLKTRFNFFGVKYRYLLDNATFSSGINFLGVYPIEVSLTWVLFKYLSFSIAILIIRAFSLPYLMTVVLTPLILVSIDIILDPVAVNNFKMWKWEKGSSYFGIPYRNFLGWFFVGFVSSLAFVLVDIKSNLAFHPLLLLPIIFYALFIRNAKAIYKIDKRKAIIGMLPSVTWTILGILSLIVIY